VHRPREALLVAGLVLLALVLRLPTAGEQSFWLDEVYTGRIVDGSLGHAWSTIGRTENTPPLFYLLDWGWGRLFGTSELALRSLSAVAGALAVVPVVALARFVGGGGDGTSSAATSALRRGGARAADALGRGAGGRTVPPRVAMAAGLLLAVNPLAHWFSQEARSYALFVLLSAVAWVALLRAADRPTPRNLWLWAAAGVAVAWTHYFGGLLFVVGWATIAVVLLARGRGSRAAALRPGVLPAVVSALGVAALLPIAKRQQSTDMYQAISLVKGLAARIVETPKQFAVGYNAPAEVALGAVLMVVLAVLVAAGAWPRAGRPTRGTLLLALVAVVWVLPILGLVVGFDVVLTRNFVLLIPPLAVLAALGAWRLGRRGWVALGAVAVVQLATIVIVALTPIYQRDDWRGALRAAEDGQPGPSLLLIGRYQKPAATYYSPTLRDVPAGTPIAVRTVVLLDRSGDADAVPGFTPPAPPAGFSLVKYESRDQWRVVVWRAPAPVPVTANAIQALAPDLGRTGVLRP
jgi:4-amino-4-deoxy-L-arabinose transferase-like glycosyltransferase